MEMPTEIYHSNLSANQYASNNEFLTDFKSNRQTASAKNQYYKFIRFHPSSCTALQAFFRQIVILPSSFWYLEIYVKTPSPIQPIDKIGKFSIGKPETYHQ
jgi:hypothetical protein